MMVAIRHAFLAAASCLAMGVAGCAGDTRPTADESSPTETVTRSPSGEGTETAIRSPSGEVTESLTGTLVNGDQGGGWYLELEEKDADTYDASRLSVMVVEEFMVTCVNSDEQVELDALPSGTGATVEFEYVLDSDPVSLPPIAILAEC